VRASRSTFADATPRHASRAQAEAAEAAQAAARAASAVAAARAAAAPPGTRAPLPQPQPPASGFPSFFGRPSPPPPLPPSRAASPAASRQRHVGAARRVLPAGASDAALRRDAYDADARGTGTWDDDAHPGGAAASAEAPPFLDVHVVVSLPLAPLAHALRGAAGAACARVSSSVGDGLMSATARARATARASASGRTPPPTPLRARAAPRLEWSLALHARAHGDAGDAAACATSQLQLAPAAQAVARCMGVLPPDTQLQQRRRHAAPRVRRPAWARIDDAGDADGGFVPRVRLCFAWDVSLCGAGRGLARLRGVARPAMCALETPLGSATTHAQTHDADDDAAAAAAAAADAHAPPSSPCSPLLLLALCARALLLSAWHAVVPAGEHAPSRRSGILEIARAAEAADAVSALSPRRLLLMQHAASLNGLSGAGGSHPGSGASSPRLAAAMGRASIGSAAAAGVGGAGALSGAVALGGGGASSAAADANAAYVRAAHKAAAAAEALAAAKAVSRGLSPKSSAVVSPKSSAAATPAGMASPPSIASPRALGASAPLAAASVAFWRRAASGGAGGAAAPAEAPAWRAAASAAARARGTSPALTPESSFDDGGSSTRGSGGALLAGLPPGTLPPSLSLNGSTHGARAGSGSSTGSGGGGGGPPAAESPGLADNYNVRDLATFWKTTTRDAPPLRPAVRAGPHACSLR
jgi:hypothetical protein